MLVLIAKYHVKAGKTVDVLAELAKMRPLVQANEPGCKCYQVSRSRENDRIVVLYEQYDDDAALDFHRETHRTSRRLSRIQLSRCSRSASENSMN